MRDTNGYIQACWIETPHLVEVGGHPSQLTGEYELVGEWPAFCSDVTIYMARGGTDSRIQIGDVIDLPPYRVRIVDHDDAFRYFTVMPERSAWRFARIRGRVAQRLASVRARVRATLYIWGLRSSPR